MDDLSNLRAVIDETREWMSGDRTPERPTQNREQMEDITVKYQEIYGALYEALQFAETVLFNCDGNMIIAARANARMTMDRFMAVQHIIEIGLASWERYQYKRGIENLKDYPHHFADIVIQALEARLAQLSKQGTVASSYKPNKQDWYPQYADLSRFGVHFEMGAEGDRKSADYGQLVGVTHFCVCGIREYMEPVWVEYRVNRKPICGVQVGAGVGSQWRKREFRRESHDTK